MKKLMESLIDEMNQSNSEVDKINKIALDFVKENISYNFDLINLDDINWKHEGYVEVEKSDFKNGFYPNYEFYRVKGELLEYMKQDDDGEFHNMIWQTVGCCEDDYSGYQLFPLSNGKYWKISYYC